MTNQLPFRISIQSRLNRTKELLNAVSDDVQFRAVVYVCAVLILAPSMAILHSNGISNNTLVTILLLILPVFCFTTFTLYKAVLSRIAKTTTDGVELRTRALLVKVRIERSLEDIKKADKQASQMRVQVLNLKKAAAKKGLTSSNKEADRILLKITSFKKSIHGRMEKMVDHNHEVNTILSQIDRIVVTQQQLRRLERVIENFAKHQREYTRQLEQFSNLLVKLQQRQEQIPI